jgi:hypothetical protein
VFVSHNNNNNNNNNANMHEPCRCMSLRSTYETHRNAIFASPVIGADARSPAVDPAFSISEHRMTCGDLARLY